MVFGQTAGDAVVDHRLVGHQNAARPSHRLLGIGEGVDAVEELGGVGAADVQPAEGRDVDEADVFAHGPRFLDDAVVAVGLGAIERRPPPEADGHHLGAGLHVAVVHGRAPLRLEAPTGEDAELFAEHRRPSGGHADLGNRAARGFGDEAGRGQRRLAPLARTHADCGEPLDQFQLAVAVGDRVADVVDLQVLIEVDELFAFGVRKDRPWVIDAGASLSTGVEAEIAVHRAGELNGVRKIIERERRRPVVVAEFRAGLQGQVIGRREAHRHADEVTVDGLLRTIRWPNDDPAHMAMAASRQGLAHDLAVEDGQPPILRGTTKLSIRRLQAQVGDRGDGNAGIGEVEGDAIGGVVSGEDHGAGPRPHAIEADQALRRRAEHDARKIVVAEHRRLLDGAGGENHALGPYLPQSVALDHRQPVVGVPGVADRIGHRRDALFGRDGGQQPFPRFGGRVPSASNRA